MAKSPKAIEDDEARRDVSPPGWSGTTEAMKKHGEISNPFALAWWMQEQGFTPHDGMNKDVLDAAHEQFCAAGHNDGVPYESAGAKAGNEGPATDWEAQTLEEEEIPEHEDSEHAPLEGPGAEGGRMPHGMSHELEHGDDDEMLLDDSEHLPGGAAMPTGDTPSVGKNVPIGIHSTIADPMPDEFGDTPITVEGEETNDGERGGSLTVTDDDDDDDEHYDDDDLTDDANDFAEHE